MSWTEVRDREGLPYGGVPFRTILTKMEVTDPAAIAQVRGYGEGGNEDGVLEDAYRERARADLVDWSSDPPGLESDGPSRDPSTSRRLINRHYNGSGSSYTDMPNHPELFIGFTGNDPRGVSNDPRFDQARGQMLARAPNLVARMGNNNSDFVAERPWTNQSISYAQKEVFRRAKRNTHVFTVSKDGRPLGRNVAAAPNSAAPRGVKEDNLGLMGDQTESVGVTARASGPKDHMSAASLTAPDQDAGATMTGRAAPRGLMGVAQPHGTHMAAADQDWATSVHIGEVRSAQLGGMLAAAVNAARGRHNPRGDQDRPEQMLAGGRPGAGAPPAGNTRSAATDADWAQALAAHIRGPGRAAQGRRPTTAADLHTGEQSADRVRGQRAMHHTGVQKHTRTMTDWMDVAQAQMRSVPKRPELRDAAPGPRPGGELGDDQSHVFGLALDANPSAGGGSGIGRKSLRNTWRELDVPAVSV